MSRSGRDILAASAASAVTVPLLGAGANLNLLLPATSLPAVVVMLVWWLLLSASAIASAIRRRTADSWLATTLRLLSPPVAILGGTMFVRGVFAHSVDPVMLGDIGLPLAIADTVALAAVVSVSLVRAPQRPSPTRGTTRIA